MKAFSITNVFAGIALIAMSMLSGCVINAGDCDIEVCTLYCDDYGCWEECEYQCEDDFYYEDNYSDGGCWADSDCANGATCNVETGACEGNGPVVGGEGDSGLCEPCSLPTDCSEDGALCVELERGAEKVCARTCVTDADCPRDFDCLDISAQVGVPNQCIPRVGDEGTRSCEFVPECRVDSECAANEVCSDVGSCVEFEPECSTNAECLNGEACVNGLCEDIPAASCEDDAGCGQGEICEANECVAGEREEPECAATADCADGLLCIDGACIDPNAECHADADCEEGLMCEGGSCVEPSCLRNADCDENELCVDAACVATCASDAECALNESCNNLGFCAAADTECGDDAQCGEGSVCNEGACVQACDASCDCPEGLVCGEQGLCEDAPAPETCETDCDCPSGQTCGDGICG